MSLADLFLPSTSQTTEEAQANYAAQQAAYNAKLQQKLQGDMITLAQYNADVASAEANAPSSGTLSILGSAAAGSVELLTDPSQWATDTKAGAQIAGDAAASAVGFSTDIFGTIVGKILAAIPLWLWLAAGAGIFLWAGGGPWLAKQLKGKLSK